MTDVQKLRALLAVATARPWRADVWYGTDDGGWAAIGPHCVASEADGFDDTPGSVSYDQAMADAALIAGAVNALPEMLDEVDRLRARKAEMCDCVHATEEEAVAAFKAELAALLAQWHDDQATGEHALREHKRRADLDSRLGDALRASGINAADALAVQALYATAGQSGSHRIVSALRAIEAWIREGGAL